VETIEKCLLFFSEWKEGEMKFSLEDEDQWLHPLLDKSMFHSLFQYSSSSCENDAWSHGMKSVQLKTVDSVEWE
jgi:hypothetical protein